MSLLSNDVSIFGTTVPNIYVKKVTIENSGFVANPQMMDRIVAHTKANGDNPYAILEETLSQDQNFTQTYQGNAIKLTVDFVMKENLGGGFGELFSSWSDKQDLQEYTDLKTIVVSDSLVHKILLVGSNMSDTIKYGSVSNKAVLAENLYYSIDSLAKANVLIDEEKQRLESIGIRSTTFIAPYNLTNKGGTSKEEVQNRLYDLVVNGIVSKKIENLKYLMANGIRTSSYAETDDDGKKIKNYLFTKTYDIDPEANPANTVVNSLYEEGEVNFLSVLATTSLDMQKLADEFLLDLSFFNKLPSPQGRVANQRILENGQISSSNYVYILDSDGSIWSGPVYEEGTQYYTGNPGGSNKQKLTKKQVQNSTVQDFRIIDRVSRLQFNLSFLNSDTISLSETKKFTRDNTDVIKQPAYFSQNYVARDYNGNARFMFGIDYYSMIRDITTFGRVLPKSPSFSSLLSSRSYSQILNMAIKRRRVDVVRRANRLGTYTSSEIPFKTGYMGEPHIDVEEIVEQIVAGKEEGGDNKFTTSPTTNTSTLQETVISVPDMNSNTTGIGFRFFTGADLQVKDFTDGNYQYGVELEILDRSTTYIINKVYNLIKAHRVLAGYYNFANIPNKTYNPNTGYFKKPLAAYYADKNFKPWKYTIDMLANTLDEFKSDNDKFDKQNFVDNMLLVCDPKSGSLRGIEALQKLVLNTASRLSAMAGTTLKASVLSKIGSSATPDATPVSVSADIFATSPDKRRIKIEYWFDGTFNTEVPKKFGYDFLTPTGNSFTPASIGLLQIPGQAFNSRLQSEMKKFFEVANPPDFEITDLGEGILYTPGDTIFTSLFSFLSPAAVNLGQGSPGGDPNTVLGSSKVSLLQGINKFYTKQFYDKKSYTYMATKIMNYNNSATIPIYDTTTDQNSKSLLSESEDKIKFYTQQILTSRNCLAVTSEELKTNKSSEPDSAGGLFVSDFLGLAIDKVDPLEKNEVKLDNALNNTISISYKGGSEVSLFLSLVYGYSNQCGGLASTKAPSQQTNKKERTFDLNLFKIGGPGVAVDPFITAVKESLDKVLPQGFITPIDTNNNEVLLPIQNELRALPNQIKSLLLEAKTNARVRHQWNKLEGIPSKDPYYKAAIAMNYRNLKEIQYLAGFQYGEEPIGVDILGNTVGQLARPMIGNPVWKTLNADVYTAAIGKSLVCRLKTYEKKAYGIEPMDCLDMPVFDEYFIVQPVSYDGSFVPAAEITPLDTSAATTSLLDQEPSDYANSDLNIPAPTVDQKMKIDNQQIIQDDTLNQVENIDIGSGLIGGAAGGPPVDQQINLEKI